MHRLVRKIENAELVHIQTNLDTLVYFPVILSDELRVDNKSRRSYSKKEEAEIVNAEIPHDQWCGTDRLGKISLLVDGLRTAIADTSDEKISQDAKEALLAKLGTIEKSLPLAGTAEG